MLVRKWATDAMPQPFITYELGKNDGTCLAHPKNGALALPSALKLLLWLVISTFDATFP